MTASSSCRRPTSTGLIKAVTVRFSLVWSHGAPRASYACARRLVAGETSEPLGATRLRAADVAPRGPPRPESCSLELLGADRTDAADTALLPRASGAVAGGIVDHRANRLSRSSARVS